MTIFSNKRLVLLLIAFIAADTGFGHLRALRKGGWSSSNARWGLISKLVELVLVALMYLCEWCFGISGIANAAIIYFIVCEAASIAENIGDLNGDIPKELPEALKEFRENIIARIISKIKGVKKWR